MQVALSCIFGDVACIVISTVVRPLLVMLRVLCELRALCELHWLIGIVRRELNWFCCICRVMLDPCVVFPCDDVVAIQNSLLHGTVALARVKIVSCNSVIVESSWRS